MYVYQSVIYKAKCGYLIVQRQFNVGGTDACADQFWCKLDISHDCLGEFKHNMLQLLQREYVNILHNYIYI